MDEIEFKEAYNIAVSCVDSEPRKAAMLMLQLINSLNERITEMQETYDDE